MRSFLLAVAALSPSAASLLSTSKDYLDDRDLFSFVTRPDIRSPRFNITTYKPDQVTPGYWFTAPYPDLHSRMPTSLFIPGQTGPHIYDSNGELVWCGAHLFDDRPTFDFKVVHHNGSQFLTFITGEDLHEFDSPGGSGIILDSSYSHVRTIEQRTGRGTMNMHEFNTIDDGKRALTITYESKFADVQDGDEQVVKMFVGNNGFNEIDTATGEAVFSWWALDHLNAAESGVERPSAPGQYGSPWDFFHLNSVDKNGDGDYLISARYTSTIYKISGKDGSIMWRFGGKESDFTLKGFNMSSQHDARFQSENETTTVITFFNNHSDGNHYTSKISSVMEVALDMTTMTATLITEWQRPDRELTKLRGNAQRLDNGHMFVGWSENTYISEFDAAGQLIMEAEMSSHRLNTYRTYKFNFTATPSEPIAVKAFVYGVDAESSTTVYYVSWNGATEVAEWKFYGAMDREPVYVGSTAKTGFETMFMAFGVATNVIVEGIDKNGNSLGKSEIVQAVLPSSWTLPHNGDIQTPAPTSDLPQTSHSQDQLSHDTPIPQEDPEMTDSTDSNWTVQGSLHFTSSIPLFSAAVVAGVLLSGLICITARRLRHRRYTRLPYVKYELLRDEV